ncbi:amidohydrolase [Flavobacterium sp.]|uniref:amidohydrolase n=1 Tax=Flavobacterium sp. TaxID=239 RepID=UPI002601DD20|nr:amidohydrolase [Flavobacterium sp.]MDD3003675.1 amidohydrolase [Flavobacterium sp.]
MKLAIVQTHIIWENAVENRSHFAQKINGSLEDVDLIVLPEMFSTGFTMHPERVAETMQGDTILWLQHLAQAKNCAIIGSLIIAEKGKFYNRLLFVYPDGTLKHYDKRHLFSLAGEDKEFSAGKNRLIVEYKGWNICPLICYDLRFPVFSRNNENYDLLIYVANWPNVRANAWNALLKARAIENMSYTVGVNRIGVDENKNKYFGDSQIIDCMGNYTLEPHQSDSMIIVELDKKTQDRNRKKFGFLNDKDEFELT